MKTTYQAPLRTPVRDPFSSSLLYSAYILKQHMCLFVALCLYLLMSSSIWCLVSVVLCLLACACWPVPALVAFAFCLPSCLLPADDALCVAPCALDRGLRPHLLCLRFFTRACSCRLAVFNSWTPRVHSSPALKWNLLTYSMTWEQVSLGSVFPCIKHSKFIDW